MEQLKIQNQAQARTAKQYLDSLQDDMMREDITLPEIQKKHFESEEIVMELEKFHEAQVVRLVVDNTKT